MATSEVDLGYLEKCESWRLESYLFPSKVGGKPAWLALQNLPSAEQLQCKKCKEPLIFLCQIYAPVEDDPQNFHRTIFIFICRNSECCQRNECNNMRVFRSSLQQNNQFYSSKPPAEDKPNSEFSLEKWLQLCDLCGCIANKQCSGCKTVNYCSRVHQVIDWKEKHKNICKTNEKKVISQNSEILFPEWELVVEPEELEYNEVNEKDELLKFEQLQKENKTGTMTEIDENELESHSNQEKDKAFSKFRKQVARNPSQVLRYHKNGEVLWIADEPIPEEIPKCDECGSERQFEFQIMPQMLSMLKENSLDWGVLVVYTCRNNCTDGNSYVEEFIFKQDVSNVE